MKVEQAWQIRNATLTRQYEAGVLKVADQCAKIPPKWKANAVRKELAAAVSQLVRQDDLEELRPEINETFLLTGVTPSVVKNIVAQGFNEQRSGSNAGTMFGDGTYFAEDAGKCDMFAAPDPEYITGSELHDSLYGPAGFPSTCPLHYIIVVRACLGHCIQTKDGRQSLDGEALFAQAGRKELASVPGSNEPYHSLLAEGLGGTLLRYREFVSFHLDSYTKPEYLIAYSRTSDTNFIEGGLGETRVSPDEETEKEVWIADSRVKPLVPWNDAGPPKVAFTLTMRALGGKGTSIKTPPVHCRSIETLVTKADSWNASKKVFDTDKIALLGPSYIRLSKDVPATWPPADLEDRDPDEPSDNGYSVAVKKNRHYQLLCAVVADTLSSVTVELDSAFEQIDGSPLLVTLELGEQTVWKDVLTVCVKHFGMQRIWCCLKNGDVILTRDALCGKTAGMLTLAPAPWVEPEGDTLDIRSSGRLIASTTLRRNRSVGSSFAAHALSEVQSEIPGESAEETMPRVRELWQSDFLEDEQRPPRDEDEEFTLQVRLGRTFLTLARWLCSRRRLWRR